MPIFGIKVLVLCCCFILDVISKLSLLHYYEERFVYRMTSCQTDFGLGASCSMKMVIQGCLEETLMKTLLIMYLTALI